jgi:tetratricopeptide (TPR) repeat protein
VTVISQLSALESAGLIRLAQFEPDLEYLFRHNLVQDAAYATLLPSDRKRLHRVVGEALEHLYPDRLNEYAAVLARHFKQAGDSEHALEYFARAGTAALATYANEEAENQYRSALALTCSEAQRASLLGGLGEALYRQSRNEEAIQTWREGINLYESLGDMAAVARLYARSGRAAWHGGDQPEGLRLCQEGLETVAGMPDSAALALLVHEAGRAYFFSGQPDKARPLCLRALEMAERWGAVDVQADTLATLGVLPDQPIDETLSALRRAVELAESAGLLEIAVRAYHNLGVITKEQEDDPRKARKYFSKAATLARQRGAAQEEMFSLSSAVGISLGLGDLAAVEEGLPRMEYLLKAIPDPEPAKQGMRDLQATLLEYRGEWAQALEMRRDRYHDARQRGDLQAQLGAATSVAHLILEMDRLDLLDGVENRTSGLAEAETALTDAIELAERGLGGKAWSLSRLSMVCTRQGRFEQARRLLAEAREKISSRSATWDELSLSMAEAGLATAEKRWTEALTIFEHAAGSSARLGIRWSWASLLQDWAEAHIGRGEPADMERAQALLREAQSAFQEMGSPYYAGLVEDRLQVLRARTVAQAVALNKAAQELAVAGRIQEGLLPKETPYLPGWQLMATLEPARETSGDFYDFIPLPNGHLGIVVADVADKGAGAALYMALSRTLIRTYASEYSSQPELTLRAANERILTETHTDMFVTVFYGVLDPQSGTLLYCNAGHNPPYLLKSEGHLPLGRTGLPLGIFEDSTWDQGTAEIAPGDALVLYTDGVTDAQTADRSLFGQERLLEVIQGFRGPLATSTADAQEMGEAVLAAMHRFVGDAPQFDDLTLMVVARR